MEHEPMGGGFGDSFVTPASTLLLVPDGLSDEQAVLAEPAAVAIHAAQRGRPEAGDHVLILGCGAIGFLLIQAVHILQPECHITALAEFPWQADLALAYGAQHTFLAEDDGYGEVAHLTDARLHQSHSGNQMLLGGFDRVYDVVGTSDTLTRALRWTRAGGRVVLVGVNLHRMELDMTPVWYQEVELIGSVGTGMTTWEGKRIPTMLLAMRWMQVGMLDTNKLLTHRFPLDDYRQAFATAADKTEHRSIKVAFEM
jgi:threonine dehydrogenase-like Zn-dependent dehydrogenase